jgi:hypothetical protein
MNMIDDDVCQCGLDVTRCVFMCGQDQDGCHFSEPVLLPFP